MITSTIDLENATVQKRIFEGRQQHLLLWGYDAQLHQDYAKALATCNYVACPEMPPGWFLRK
jgi:hypothetical protein